MKNKAKKLLTGVVLSDKMQKTIVVVSERLVRDPRFHKYIKRRKKYMVEDANSQARQGDVVEFYEGRPISKNKYMYLERVIKPVSLK